MEFFQNFFSFVNIVIGIVSIIILFNIIKTEYPRFYKILCKFLFYLLIIIIVTYLFADIILSFVDSFYETPISIGIGNIKLEKITFLANSPLESNQIVDLRAQFLEADTDFQNKYDQMISKVNRATYLYNNNVAYVEYSLKNKDFAMSMKEGIPERDFYTAIEEVESLAKQIKQDAELLKDKLAIVTNLDSRAHYTSTKYTNSTYHELYSNLNHYQTGTPQLPSWLAYADHSKFKYVDVIEYKK
jgi:hypothetical protein